MTKSKLTKVGYELESINIVQTPISYVDHRSECDPMVMIGDKKVFPVIVSPMGSVTDENNYKTWLEHGFMCCVPRTVNYLKRIEISKETFASFSLSEAETIDEHINDGNVHYICIDIAHGTMNWLYKVCKHLKKKFGDKIILMTGNVATPDAFPYYTSICIDYMRATIGTGSRCVAEGTKITMADGSLQNIEDIDKGDYVKTLNGNCKVINKFNKNTNSTILINDEIEVTNNHKFFVLDKDDIKDNMTDEEIKSKGFYLEADKLSDKYVLVMD